MAAAIEQTSALKKVQATGSVIELSEIEARRSLLKKKKHDLRSLEKNKKNLLVTEQRQITEIDEQIKKIQADIRGLTAQIKFGASCPEINLPEVLGWRDKKGMPSLAVFATEGEEASSGLFGFVVRAPRSMGSFLEGYMGSEMSAERFVTGEIPDEIKSHYQDVLDTLHEKGRTLLMRLLMHKYHWNRGNSFFYALRSLSWISVVGMLIGAGHKSGPLLNPVTYPFLIPFLVTAVALTMAAKYQKRYDQSVTTSFTGLIPMEIRILIRKKRTMFDSILILAEPGQWKVVKEVAPRPTPILMDPLVVGLAGNRAFVLGAFDTTPIEDAAALTFPEKIS